MHDAFQPLESWKGFMPSPSWQNVALDTHCALLALIPQLWRH